MSRGGLLSASDVSGLFSFGALDNVELNRLALGQSAKPFHLDRSVMDKNVATTTIAFNKPKAFLVIEPLHLPNRHPFTFFPAASL